MNDFLDLTLDSTCGRGRPAIRAARTLFELLVAWEDVLADRGLDRRYADHVSIGGVLLGSLTREADALPRDEAKELRSASDALREGTMPLYDEAIARFGSDYVRGWAGRDNDLRRRAENHGLESDYQTFYKWASTEGHGSPAVQHGHWRPIGDFPTYRLGPALAACPTALAHGLDYFDRIIAGVASVFPPSPAIDDFRSAVTRLRVLFPAYRRAILAIDDGLWPDES